ncbi:hypothetical protein BGZ67_009416 [Mortierella alpina]|nr:hypothetical protein BGZ67_009416 [Mortierella alpina]
MLGHQQLLQQQQHHHHTQQQHPHNQLQHPQSQHLFGHPEAKSIGLNKQPHPHRPLSSSSSSSNISAAVNSLKASSGSASLPPAYPCPSHTTVSTSTPSLPSVSSSSSTLASATGDASTGTGESFVPNIKKAKYSTSLDPRGFIPVYEYELYGHPIMWDQENLYVHFTGIWKALGKTKADIVKIIDANPILETIIRKVRGGFLKIQGTWMPHQEAYDLAKKTCYKLRYELVPVFGPGFINDCIPPDAPGFGSIHLTVVRRRASECMVGQRQVAIGAQQLRLQQTHLHPSLKRRYSSNDVSRLGRLSQTNSQSTSQLSSSSSSSFLLGRNKEYQRDGSIDGEQDDDLDLDLDEGDVASNQTRNTSEQHRQQRFYMTSRFDSSGDQEDDDDDEDERLLDGSTEDEEEHQSLSGSYDDDDVDIEGESCTSEQEDSMYNLARLDLSRRNSSPMPMNTAYALSANGSGAKTYAGRGRRGRPPARSPMPIGNRIAANYVAYNNYVSSNTQAAQGLGRNGGHSTRTQKQQLRQQQKLQNQLLQQQHQSQRQLQQYQQQQQQQQQQSYHHHHQHQPLPPQPPPQQQHQHQPNRLPFQMRPQDRLTQEHSPSGYHGASSAPSLSGLTHQELVEFFKAGQALQRMSQDDGVRPWKQDGGRMILPKKIVLGEQVFQCVAGEYKCVAEPNNSSSSKPPGEDDGWPR